MSFNPNDSAIKVTKTLEEQIAAASSQAEVQAILRQAALAQHVVVPDAFDPNVLHQVEPGTAPRKFAQTVEIGGVKRIFEGNSELEVAQQVNEFMRQTFAQPAATMQQNDPTRDERGRFVSAEEAVAKAELELKFKRGEIDTATYLAQSGAIESYLATQGIDPDALREVSGQKFQNSWADATSTFLNSPEGADWPGGQENVKIAGQLLEEHGLVDNPSAETLASVWKYMKENNLAVENSEVIAQQRIADAKSPEEIRAALGRDSSSFFGGR